MLGNTYVFNLNDLTVASHPFGLSTTSDGTHGGGQVYETGVTYALDGTAKVWAAWNTVGGAHSTASQRRLTFTPTESGSYHYFCGAHASYGAAITIAASTSGGVLTVITGETVSTNNNDLVLTSWDIDLFGSINTGTRGMVVHGSTGSQTISIGVPHVCTSIGTTSVGSNCDSDFDDVFDQSCVIGAACAPVNADNGGCGDTGVCSSLNLKLSGEELQRVAAAGFTVGSSVSGSVHVTGVKTAQTSGISDVVSIVASNDAASVVFNHAGSTFTAVSVQSDDGVDVNKGVTTMGGGLWMDGDIDDAIGSDALNKIRLANGMTMVASTTMTLAASTGSVTALGTVTLKAGSGLVLLDDLVGSGASSNVSKTIVLDVDFDSTGDGTLTVLASKSVTTSSSSDLIVTAWDVDLSGSLIVGSGQASIHGAHSGQTIGVGSVKDLHMSGVELGKVSAAGLSIGSSSCGSITVEGITADQSGDAASVKLLAQGNAGMVTFSGAGSTFSAVTARGDSGVAVDVVVTSGTGGISLDGDSDSSALGDTPNTVSLVAGGILHAETVLTLAATTGAVQCAGTATLRSGAGIVLLSNMTGAPGGAKPIVLVADSNADGTGALSVTSGAHLVSRGNKVLVTAWDLDLAGAINTGTEHLEVHCMKGAGVAECWGQGRRAHRALPLPMPPPNHGPAPCSPPAHLPMRA